VPGVGLQVDRDLTVDQLVARLEVGVRCPQRHHQADQLHDDEGGDRVVPDDEEQGEELDQELVRVAIPEPGDGRVRGALMPRYSTILGRP